jgi:hypothetical protein
MMRELFGLSMMAGAAGLMLTGCAAQDNALDSGVGSEDTLPGQGTGVGADTVDDSDIDTNTASRCCRWLATLR